MGAGKLIKGIDYLVSQAYLQTIGERNALLCFLFHGLFENEAEMEKAEIAPLQRTTVATLRLFVEYFLGQGYTFVTHREILRGLEPERRYAIITFDDGYFNNVRALPVLEEFSVPAVFFISSNHVDRQTSFWWDVFHRECRRRGWSEERIDIESADLKRQTCDRIEAELVRQFSGGCLRARSDLDRPFTRAELVDFARAPGVFIGNHTADHAVLTNYPLEGVRRQIAEAQAMLGEILGEAPDAIAYPNGNFNDQVMEVSRECGLRIGFTCERRKVLLTRDGRPACGPMRLGRYYLRGNHNLDYQLANIRSDCSPYGWYKSLTSPGY